MKKVLITGASRGIGLATAKKFLKEGYSVIGTSTSGKSPIKDKNFEAIRLDLRNPKSISEAAKIVKKKWSSIDILVNNAGVGLEPDTNLMDVRLLRATLEINLIGLIDFTEQVLPSINSGGHIVNISSGMGSLIQFDNGIDPAYRISKTAVNMYTKCLSDRLKEKKVTVSSFDPGWVKTDMGGQNAPRTPDIPAEEIFNLVNSRVESGHFWYAGQKRSW